MEPYIGEIKLFSYDRVPKGWLRCDGKILDVATNQVLFSLLSNLYGGDGRVNFALPDLRGRVPVGSPGRTSSGYGIGTAGGAESVVLTTDKVPSHTHLFQVNSRDGSALGIAGNVYAGISSPSVQNIYGDPPPDKDANWQVIDPATVGVVGKSAGHSNMQPYTALNYCIATVGVYPPRSN